MHALRFLLVHPVGLNYATNEDLVVVADVIGAGEGEMVLCAYGHAARTAVGTNLDISIEAAVIGIVDELEASPELKGKLPPVKGPGRVDNPADSGSGDKQEN